jgi:epsilon-lactone hydrolase
MPSKESQKVREVYARWTWNHRNPHEVDPYTTDEHWGDLTGEPGGLDYTEVDAGGTPGMWLDPKGAARDRVLLCLHGGGYISGSLYTHRKLYGWLAKLAGTRALLVTYRHTPEHPFPAALEDTGGAYRWLLGQGVAPGRIAFAGDSAGGSLVLATALWARERELPLPAAIMPIPAWVDLEQRGATYDTNRASDPFFHREVVQNLADMYLAGGTSPHHPLAAPLYADFTGMPPMYLQAGEDETCLDDSRMIEKHARDHGVDVFPGQQHSFQMAAGHAAEAGEALRSLAAWVRPHLGLGDPTP